MELRDIEYFAIVAEHGHLGRAAEALGLSTPALSKSLRRLEKAMQAKLVARTPKGVELTAEGNALLSHVRPLRLSLQDVARKVADLSQGRSGHLRFGSIQGPADYLLPAAYGAFLNDAPNVTVTITVANGATLVSALRNGELDLIVFNVAVPPDENILAEPLFEEELVVYGSVNHRLAKRDRVEIADLAQERWAFSSLDSAPTRWLYHMFENNGLATPPEGDTGEGPVLDPAHRDRLQKERLPAPCCPALHRNPEDNGEEDHQRAVKGEWLTVCRAGTVSLEQAHE